MRIPDKNKQIKDGCVLEEKVRKKKLTKYKIKLFKKKLSSFILLNSKDLTNMHNTFLENNP